MADAPAFTGSGFRLDGKPIKAPKHSPGGAAAGGKTLGGSSGSLLGGGGSDVVLMLAADLQSLNMSDMPDPLLLQCWRPGPPKLALLPDAIDEEAHAILTPARCHPKQQMVRCRNVQQRLLQQGQQQRKAKGATLDKSLKRGDHDDGGDDAGDRDDIKAAMAEMSRFDLGPDSDSD